MLQSPANAHMMRRLGVSRRALFESVERAALRPLSAADYEYAEWRFARVNLDYHVEAAGFLYSVPHALIREQVDVRLTKRTVEVFHRGQRVAAHPAATEDPDTALIPAICQARTGATPSGHLTALAAGRARLGPRQKG
jgi:hypothetical protein